MIRVLLVDDHQMFREGLRDMLTHREGFTVVGQASDGEEALRLVDELNPDVAVVDISMPRKDGIETTSEIAAKGNGTRVLILTMFNDEQHALRGLRAGAAGFLSKSDPFENLVAAITQIASGRRYLPGRIQDELSSELAAGTQVPRRQSEALSRREFQVMRFLADGMTNRQIAGELGISVKTVDTHRGHVLKKLLLRNNSDITRFAIRNGYLEA